MRTKCECGHELDVPGNGRVVCPKCGREVTAPAADWLDALDMEDMSLDGVVPAPEQEAPTTAAPTPEPAVVPPADSVPQAEPSAAGKAQELQAQQRPGLLGFILLARDRPKEAARHLETGIASVDFVVQTVVSLLVLWALAAGIMAYLQFPMRLEASRAVVAFVWLLVEFVSAGIMVALLCVLFNRRVKPLGVVEGVAVVRVVALAAMAPIAIVLAVAMAATFDPATGASAFLLVCARWTPRLWALVTFVLQAGLLIRLLGRGCWPPVAVSLVVSYGAATLASKVAAIF